MFEITGKYGTCKIFNDVVEETAMSQIYALMSHKIVEGHKVAFMPDIHAGAGCVIGTTMELGDIVIPSIIGVDIGCGVIGYNLGKIDIDFQSLDDVIRKYIPYGFAVNEAQYPFHREKLFYNMVKDICKKIDLALGRVKCAIGTLGGGNHFIEIDESEEGEKWLTIHSGSRNFGLKIALYHQKKANVSCGGKFGGLAWLEDADAQEYYCDMKIAQEYALLNRAVMGAEILKNMNWSTYQRVESIHNYIDFTNDVVRKGAISAGVDEDVIIPLNMKDGVIIGKGKGNPDWNFSAPHGAGRIMSRSKAKKEVSLEDYKEIMKDVWSTCIGKSTLDESPFAYKNPKGIIKYFEPSVEVIERLKSVYVFKDH